MRGPAFIAAHELFDKASGEAEKFSNLIAERAGALGGTAQGAVQVTAERSFLVPSPLGIADESQQIFPVSAALAAFGQSVHEAIAKVIDLGDATMANLFSEISRGVDLQLWFFESHVAPN